MTLLLKISHPEDAAASARYFFRSTHPAPWMGMIWILLAASGQSVYPEDGEDAETLIKNAEGPIFQPSGLFFLL